MAVWHATDHIHLVATLCRQDRHRPDLWNSYRKLRGACRDTEEWFGLRRTAAADCTAVKRDSRAESEQALRRGWDEPPRTWLRREVCTAAARQAAEQLYAAFGRARDRVSRAGGITTPAARRARRADAEFPMPVAEVLAVGSADQAARVGSSPRVVQPPARARPTR